MLGFAQAPVFLLQIVQAESSFDRQREQFGFEWLGEEIVGAKTDGTQGVGAVVLSGEDDHLGVRCRRQCLLEQAEAFRDRIGRRRQPEVHGDDGRIVAMNHRQGAFAIARRQRFELVQRPAHLLLQRRVVFDNEQWPDLFRAHAASFSPRSDSVRNSKSGRIRVMRVP